MSNVTDINEKLKDYTSYRPAALKLIGNIRHYWNQRGFEPEITLIEEIVDGTKVFSVRSDIPTTGPNRMSKYVKPRVAN